jgi:hypothetical protein
MNDPSTDPTAAGDLTDELAGRPHRGERPAQTEHANQHPEPADRTRELFPAPAETQQIGSSRGPETGTFFSGALRDAPVPRVLGEYRVVREIGRGGMGVGWPRRWHTPMPTASCTATSSRQTS